MGQSQQTLSSASKNVTPQATGGFSQVQARGGGEGGGQQMSVLLSWHEKVCLQLRLRRLCIYQALVSLHRLVATADESLR
jgi:hypothetical protein